MVWSYEGLINVVVYQGSLFFEYLKKIFFCRDDFNMKQLQVVLCAS